MSIFSEVGRIRPPKRSAFDLSFENKLSLNFGQLVPVYLEEVVPGDKVKLNAQIFLRFAPLLAPVMHRVNVFTHFFFVPNRLLWSHWADNKEGFITGGREGDSEKIIPSLEVGSIPIYNSGSLADYMGVYNEEVAQGSTNTPINILPFRAYQLIYNEFYRDQNLEEEVDFNNLSDSAGESVQLDELFTLRYRAWEKDYFTSALPWTQRGEDLSLNTGSTVTLDTSAISSSVRQKIRTTGGGTQTNLNYPLGVDSQGNLTNRGLETEPFEGPFYEGDTLNVRYSAGTATDAWFDPNGTLKTSGSVTIQELRNAIDLQSWLEMNARGGSRYIEQILYHFGIRVPDYQLQRPQYLGGGKSPVVISEVLQQSPATTTQGESTVTTPLGRLGGHALSVGLTHEFKHWFNEHGYIIGIMSVIPKSCYQQGLRRLYSKFDRFDYFWPKFQHLGEQEIKNKEIFLGANGDNENEGTFGYTPRYAEYKFHNSEVHGDFRDSLSFWHLGRIFEELPTLSSEFVHVDPSTIDRIFPVEVEASENQTIYAQLFFDNKWIRPMSRFGTPKTIG